MNLNSVASSKSQTRFCRILIVAFVLISSLNLKTYAQNGFTREQFSRLPVLTRARFFEAEILRAAKREGVDPNLLWAIAYNETRFRPWLTSPQNAQGLMQFIPATAARFDLENPYEPVSAIRAAARYVKYLSNLFGGRIDSILAAYNSGEGTVSAYLDGRTVKTKRKIINPKGIKILGGIPPYAETIQYVGRGLKIYRWLILRGTFPPHTTRAVFPSDISANVAKVSLLDGELGKIPAFKAPPDNLPKVSQTSARQVIVSESVFPDMQQNPQINNLTEIYYDARSGSRYRVINGIKTKLDESGVVVITDAVRPATTNKARSTFFASIAEK